MKILAIDTSSFPASVAIADDGILLGEYIIRNQRKHSQNIMMMTERLFDDLGMDISDIDVFAVTSGPGSFTGLRIGISSVRAFAQAMKKPVAAVNTLEALAYNFSFSDTVIVPMLDARRDEVFTAAYRFKNGTAEEITPPCVMTIDEICETYKTGNVIFTGDGAIIHKDELCGFTLAPMNLSETRASSLALAAYKKAEKNELCDYNHVSPLYLRKSQAEREYEGRENK
ncbi:MAG: tRNA (adenosine(37)-N6)-threonylcarbamoyltransferase complex dimerization subunit type 1 TsaB [Clostridia bacterium]|nr:tRNA (adenosine(37)-N6)-threonylcarbamoyltransferase complex dimerization subunit type 1 TsaB [Clostridia bacterium]